MHVISTAKLHHNLVRAVAETASILSAAALEAASAHLVVASAGGADAVLGRRDRVGVGGGLNGDGLGGPGRGGAGAVSETAGIGRAATLEAVAADLVVAGARGADGRVGGSLHLLEGAVVGAVAERARVLCAATIVAVGTNLVVAHAGGAGARVASLGRRDARERSGLLVLVVVDGLFLPGWGAVANGAGVLRAAALEAVGADVVAETGGAGARSGFGVVGVGGRRGNRAARGVRAVAQAAGVLSAAALEAGAGTDLIVSLAGSADSGIGPGCRGHGGDEGEDGDESRGVHFEN